jgi:hypothetical protein
VRAVRGETCDEVVSAIALVTALAIDAGTTESSAPVEGAPAPPRDEGAREPAPVARAPSKGALRKPEPNVVVGSLGAETGVATWLGPSPTLGFGVFGEVGTYAGASGRLTLLATASSTLVENEEEPGTYRRANFNGLIARIEGCPVVWVLGSGFRVVPCLALGLGALRGAGEERSVHPPRNSTIFWADLVPTLRLDWTVSDSLVFFGQGELGVPLVRHDFVFDGPRQPVFQVPAVGAGAALGMAWRFP